MSVRLTMMNDETEKDGKIIRFNASQSDTIKDDENHQPDMQSEKNSAEEITEVNATADQSDSRGEDPETQVDEDDVQELPDALSRFVFKMALLAFIILIATVASVIVFKSWEFCLMLLLCVYLAHEAFSVVRDYYDGTLVCVRMICINAKAARFRKNNVTVNFREDSDAGRSYQFRVAGKSSLDEFIPGGSYDVYFRPVNPTVLIAFEPSQTL